MKFKTFAAIDIGSNAVRMLINNIENEGGKTVFKKVAFLRVPIRLGEDTFGKGKIGGSKLYRLNEAMIGFSHIIKAYKVSEFKAYATSAMRDAANGAEVVEMIRENSGIDITIITGKEEAEIIFQAGGLHNVMDESRNYLYVDVGGGSTEIVVYSKQQKVESNSFQIGTVRMLEDAVKKEEIDFFKDWLKKAYSQYGPLSVIGSGGNINKIYKMLNKENQAPLSYQDLNELYEKLKDMSIKERIQNFQLNAYRADVIVPALKIFLTVGETCHINEFYVPKVGLADGMIYQMYSQSLKDE